MTSIGSPFVFGTPIDIDPKVNRECADLKIKARIAQGIDDVEFEVRRIYHFYRVSYETGETERIARQLAEQVEQALTSWQKYEKGGSTFAREAGCPCTWECRVDTMGNTRATLLQEAFNNQWTDEDKKEFLYQAGAPFPELLKIALLNPHVLRDLEIAERERCRRKREALVKKVKKLLSLHTVTLSLASIGLLLTRPICRWTMGYGEPEEIYIFIRWGVALIAIWQAIRLFRAKRAFYVAILLCASAIILNPLRDVDIDEDVYAWLYAIMTFPFALTITSEWRSLTRNVQDAGTATQPHTHERE